MSTYLAARHRVATRIPLQIVDETHEITVNTAERQASEGEPKTPLATRVEILIGATVACTGGLILLDWSKGLPDPIVSGHLRTAFAITVVSLVMLVCTRRLYILVQPLYDLVRRLWERVRWLEERSKMMDERDAAMHRHLDSIAEDMVLIGRTVADLRRTIPDLMAAVGYANTRLNAIGQQVVSVGGGQAAIAGAVDQLAHVMAYTITRQASPGPNGSDRGEPDGDGWREYLRDGGGDPLNFDQLRGYLMGIYDREHSDGEDPDPVA